MNQLLLKGKFKMRFKAPFSILELMTVILVILLLISLLIPVLINVKMNARNAICKNNLRQIGSLITVYQADNEGHLPNDDAYGAYYATPRSDLPNGIRGRDGFYRNWNGHLLPYLEVNLPDKYVRRAMVTKKGCTRYLTSQLGGIENSDPKDVLKNGWIVVDDAFRKGGYQDLKLFICPEIHQNTFDVAASIVFNGVKIPRISQLCAWGFEDIPGYDYGMTGGIPTTYLANDVYFGLGLKNSFRMDQIPDISQKAFLLEGGHVYERAFAYAYETYYHVGQAPNDGFDLGTDHPGDCASTISAKDPRMHKLSYVHDNYDQFWISDDGNIATWGVPRDLKLSFAAKFNTQFEGIAYMIPSTNAFRFTIVSFIDPQKGKIFEAFLNANAVNTDKSWGNFVPFIDEPNDFKYLTGNMNVLFGDGSVDTKDQAWLSFNRIKISQ